MMLSDMLFNSSSATTTTTTTAHNIGGASSSSSSTIAYKHVRLVDDHSVDLYIHNSRGKGLWSYDQWLEEGRPRELSSLNLSAWSLLTTSIREYQTGLRRYTAKIYLRMILPIYVVWFVSLFVMDLETVHSLENPAWILTYYLTLIVMIVVAAMIASHYKQQHVDQIFNPAVQLVLEELRPKLTEAGYDVVLMVETGQWCQYNRPTKAFLRFTPLPDEERRAAAAAAVANSLLES